MKHGAWPQQRELRDSSKTKRFKVIVAHRRFGKTMFGISRLLHAATEDAAEGGALRLSGAVPAPGQGGGVGHLKH